MPRLTSVIWVTGLGVLVGCNASIVEPNQSNHASEGGHAGASTTTTTLGGSNAHGGSASGGSSNGSGGASQGGAMSSMGGASGGTNTQGGTGSGGTNNNAGGTNSGGSSGGRAAGGSSSGGTSNNAGGTNSKGGASSSGGTSSMGGSNTGGTTSSTGDDGCQGGPAQNITLSQVAAYQSVKVPLMQGGNEVASASRKAQIVAGKDAVFRLFVTVGSGFSARSLSGRVFVDNGGTVDMYYAKLNVTGNSAEGTLGTTFQVTVPKEKLTRTTQYYAEVVECGTGSGGVQSPRFPATGQLALGVRETGVLKIKVIPLSANSMVPDTSATALEIYKKLFMAMYPITSIDMSVGDTLTVSNAQDWTGMLDQVRAKRQSDQPTPDVYYYGFLKPTSTLQQYCGSGCTAGIGYVVNSAGTSTQTASQRASLGLAFADNTSAQTMAHEIGHNHGRNHAPCVQGGSISGVDANFPTSNGQIGSYGWDSRTSALIAPDRTDIMGYCNNKWISDYTYNGMTTRVATLNGAPMNVVLPPELIHPWRVLLLDAGGPRWGIPITDSVAPAGAAELADVLDANGVRITRVNVFRTEISDIDAFSFEVPPPEPGWAAVQVAGAPPIRFAP
ncbi:MAG: zinc-dependent metalloprotease family protein [Myxococcota bacterium]